MFSLSFSLYDLEFFLLIVVRITCFVATAPLFNNRSVTNRFKVTFGIFVAYVIYHFVQPESMVQYSSPWDYAIIVMKEAVVGLLIGFGANICTSIMSFAGRIMDMEMGLSMATIYDPSTRENTTLSGSMLNYLSLMMLLLTGLHRYLIQAIVETYRLIPVNGAVLEPAHLMDSMVRFMGDFFSIGFRICLPVFASIMLLNAVLGILAKVSPQLNMFAVGHQLKILVGLGVTFLTINILPYASEMIYTEIKTMVVSFVEAMM